jgi:small-conductance mechanosensitive channel
MTFAELLLALFGVVGLYYALRPLQRYLEKWLLRLLGVRGSRILDATIVDDPDSKT